MRAVVRYRKRCPREAWTEQDTSFPSRGHSVADIRVERRPKMGKWPWAVGLLVLALAIWALAEILGEDDGDEIVDELDRGAATAPR